jgi:hypothetical protein
MWVYLIGAFFLGALLAAVVLLSKQNGKLTEQVKSLKEQAKEQARADGIESYVSYLSSDDARELLHKIANEQQDRMQ